MSSAPKYDWYQTETTVVVEVRIKKLSSEQVTVEFTDTSLNFVAKMSDSNEFVLDFNLCHPINAQESAYKILGTKVINYFINTHAFRETMARQIFNNKSCYF